MKKGSITVFAALSFMLIASFLFALLEAGRVYVLDAYADMTAELAVESVVAEYQPILWEDYKLLCLDGAYGGQEFGEEYVGAVLGARLCKNLSQSGAGSRIMGMSLAGAQVDAYQLLTDGDGGVFLNCVANYMRDNLPLEAAQILYERYREREAVEQNGPEAGSIEKAQTAIEEAKKAQEEQKEAENDGAKTKGMQDTAREGTQSETSAGESVSQKQEEVQTNPLEIVLEMKKSGLLGMVTDGIGGLSGRQVAVAERIEKRSRQDGTMQKIPESRWYDRVLVLEYLGHYFADYSEGVTDHSLSYEVEYVLCGEKSDQENLKGVVNRLLLIREAANVTHILSDAKKREEALAIAGALAGFTGNPAIIKVVEIGVVAAWAYVESLLDIRALLGGDKIALIKTPEQWSVRLGELAGALGDGARAKNCEDGFTYLDYLKGFLFTMPDRKLAYRMLDIMEDNVRQIPAYQNCRMDYMICALACEMEYQSDPLFWNYSILSNTELGRFSFCKEKRFAYYD